MYSLRSENGDKLGTTDHVTAFSHVRLGGCNRFDFDKDVRLRHFQVTEARLQSPDYLMRSDRITRLSPSRVSLRDTLPAHSITVYTSVAHDTPNEATERNKHEFSN